jgi:hypothetical protein
MCSSHQQSSHILVLVPLSQISLCLCAAVITYPGLGSSGSPSLVPMCSSHQQSFHIPGLGICTNNSTCGGHLQSFRWFLAGSVCVQPVQQEGAECWPYGTDGSPAKNQLSIHHHREQLKGARCPVLNGSVETSCWSNPAFVLGTTKDGGITLNTGLCYITLNTLWPLIENIALVVVWKVATQAQQDCV